MGDEMGWDRMGCGSIYIRYPYIYTPTRTYLGLGIAVSVPFGKGNRIAFGGSGEEEARVEYARESRGE